MHMQPWRSAYLTRLITLFLSISLLGCAAVPPVDPVSDNLHTTLQRLATQHHVCAVAVAVIKNRELDALDFASGCTPALAPTGDSVFQAASLSKPVFAYEVLKLVEQGKLDLDTPVMHYLPAGYRHRFNPLDAEPAEPVSDPRLRAVTPRMLLNHTSGLPNWASGPLRFESTPGEKWEYSGEGYLLLQRAAEAVNGEPLDRLISAQLFRPLGMDRSDYVLSPGIAEHLLPGTKANGSARSTLALKEPIAAFSLHTSAADYGKFLVALLKDEHALRRIGESPVTVDHKLNLSWGLGWGIERTQNDLYLWQWGNNTGYRAFVMVSARTGDGFVMLTNSENGLKLAEPVTQKILPDEHTLFQSPILGGGILEYLCVNLHLCL
jgi:CubicO group peptidase (beta-lactamase class C family)